MFDNTVKMTGMFIGNEKLSTVDLSAIDTSNVKDTSYMFHKCYSLNVSEENFNLTNVENKNNMFIQRLKNAIIKDVKSDEKIDFSKVSSSTNGQGLYLRSGTKKDENPIYYYRGSVSNNNVVFANKCWKIVRTTDTGGIKLVYNGVPQDTYNILIDSDKYINVSNDSVYPFKYNDSTNKWTSTNKTHSKTGTLSFSVAESGNYVLDYTVSSESCCDKAYFYKDGEELSVRAGSTSGTIKLGYLTSSNVIMVKYTKDGSVSNGTDSVTFNIDKVLDTPNKACNNTGVNSQIGTNVFNSEYTSPAHVGYMYGSAYTVNSKSAAELTSGIIYGNDVTYSNGKYTLKDTYTSTSVWSSTYNAISPKYHYTCFSTSKSCEEVGYIFFGNTSNAYYMKISNGATHLSILDEMLKDSTNENSSTIKTMIDTWYQENLINYASSLEDTVWCNDRTVYALNGWNKNSQLKDYLRFGTYGTVVVKFTPSLTCSNKNDRFTVSSENGNGKLTYPIALLTADEVAMAGAKQGSANPNSSFYLYTGTSWRIMTPYRYDEINADTFMLSNEGTLEGAGGNGTIGVRPAISLKSEIDYVSGAGTKDNPYVIVE